MMDVQTTVDETPAPPLPPATPLPAEELGLSRPRLPHGALALVLLLFLFSGASGLVYEVIWTRLLLTVFGATLYAVTTVLAAFMGGLALGSVVGGRLADRTTHPLRLYGAIELLVAVTALCVGRALGWFDPIYRSMYASGTASFLQLSLVRFGLSFLVLLIPTTGLGATLPLLSRFLVRRGDVLGGRIGGLYAVNTTGAVAGTFLAGFFLIARLGVSGTIALAAATSALVGVAALLLSAMLERRSGAGFPACAPPPERQAGKPAPHPLPVDASPAETMSSDAISDDAAPEIPAGLSRLVLVSYGLSGFVALAYQVFWTRALVFRFEYLKNTTYAFSAMLTVFLVGLAAGSALMSAVIDRQRHPVRLYGLIQVLTGMSGGLLSLLMLTRYAHLLPLPDPLMSETGSIRWGVAVVNVMLQTAATIGLPTFLMGMAFPVAARVCVRHLRAVGSGTGRLYAYNTVGAILGSFAAGFVLIPLLGLSRGILTLGLVNVLIGAVVLSLAPARGEDVGGGRAFWPAVATVLVGVFALFMVKAGRIEFQTISPGYGLRAYAEGPLATVSVIENPIGDRTLYVDNVGVAGTDRILLTDQKSLAHVPVLFMEDPKSALTVGFGSGGASWSYLQYREMEHVDCIEICDTVLQMAPDLKASNHGLLDGWDGRLPLTGRTSHDGRYRVLIDDARSYLRFTQARYDIIATDCTDLRYKSNANLYDVEYFELCRQALTDQGMVVVWMPLAGMTTDVFACALQTFAKVFPDMTVWYMDNQPTHYLLLIGTQHGLKIDIAKMQERLARPEVRKDLEEVGLQQAEKILSCYLCSADDLKADFDQRIERLPFRYNTEDHPVLEFESPKFGYGDEALLVNLEVLRKHRQSVLPYLADAAQQPEFVKRLERFESAVDPIQAGLAAYRRLEMVESAKHFLEAAKICPEDQAVAFLLRFDELRRRADRDRGINLYWDLVTLGRIELLQEHYKPAADLLLKGANGLAQGLDASAPGPGGVPLAANEAGGRDFQKGLYEQAVVGAARCYIGLGFRSAGLTFLSAHEARLGERPEFQKVRQDLRDLPAGDEAKP
jgi:spermidine synthase